MTDISVIARDTKIGMPATRFLGPALGSLHMFFHRLGPVLARRLLLTGDIIEAGAIEHLGIFTDTCDPGAVTARARYWAEKAAKMPPTGSSSPRRRSGLSSRARRIRVRRSPATCSTPSAPTCNSGRANSTSSRPAPSTAPGRPSGYATSTSTCPNPRRDKRFRLGQRFAGALDRPRAVDDLRWRLAPALPLAALLSSISLLA